jgi:hypothetical protein
MAAPCPLTAESTSMIHSTQRFPHVVRLAPAIPLPAPCRAPLLHHRVFPKRAKPLRQHCFVHASDPLCHRKRPESRLAQMPQLCGDARWRVVRQLRQLIQGQPCRALPRTQHHVANHVSLLSNWPQTFLILLRSRHLHRLLSQSLVLQLRKLIAARTPVLIRAIHRLFIILVRHPCSPLWIFVVSGASAASSPRQSCGQRLVKAVRQGTSLAVPRMAHTATKVFRSFPQPVPSKYS